MILWGMSNGCSILGIPRESGDDPALRNSRIAIIGYSPRERG